MTERRVIVTRQDSERLERLLRDVGGARLGPDLAGLAHELERAVVVPPDLIPPHVVTMNSEVLLCDNDSGEYLTCRLVFPSDADASGGAISVLAPVGTAILGYSEGDTISWPVPSGQRHLRIERVTYQPEAAGDFEL